MATAAERLAEVQSAISAVLNGGQSVQFGDRRVQMADLAELRRAESELIAVVASQTRKGRNRVLYVIPQ